MLVCNYLEFYVEHPTNTHTAALALADQEAAALAAGNATAVAGMYPNLGI